MGKYFNIALHTYVHTYATRVFIAIIRRIVFYSLYVCTFILLGLFTYEYVYKLFCSSVVKQLDSIEVTK
jgi:hypothetical protein